MMTDPKNRTTPTPSPAPSPTPSPIRAQQTAQPGAQESAPPPTEAVAKEASNAAAAEEELTTVTESPAPAASAEELLGSGFWPGLVIGLLAGGALAACLARRLRGTAAGKASVRPGKLRVTSIQGLGAREDQQDSLYATEPELYNEQGILLCVADGMGGLKNGRIISQTAVSAIVDTFPGADKSDPQRLLAALVQSANSAVNTLLSPELCSGGTTLLLAFVKDGTLSYATVGDSRICLLRGGELLHLNRPHTFEDELLLSHVNGEISYDQARTYQKRGALTSFLGMGALRYLDIPDFRFRLHRGDRIILMSDGVFNTLSDEELAEILKRGTSTFADRIAEEIEKKGNPYQDNYTALILAVD